MREDNIEAFTLCAFNHTAEWIASKAPEERDRIIREAKKDTPALISQFKERKKDIEEGQKRRLEEQQEEVRQKEEKAAAEKAKLVARVEEMGGVWQSGEEVDEKIKAIKEGSRGESIGKVREALKTQINYRRQILKQPVKVPGDWKFSVNGRPCLPGELTQNLKNIIAQL